MRLLFHKCTKPSLVVKTYQAYLFDLDGTLVDTAPDIHEALNYALQKVGLGKVDIALTRHWVGHGSRVLVDRALSHHQITNTDDNIDPESVQTAFINHYAANLANTSTIYPGVIDTLRQLRSQDARLAVVTNKLTQLSQPLLEQIGLASLFDLIVCGDTTAHPKPAPDPIDYCLTNFRVDASQALMVGDSETDVGAARAAGIDVACVPDGYNHGLDVNTLSPTYVIDSFQDLLPQMH